MEKDFNIQVDTASLPQVSDLNMEALPPQGVYRGVINSLLLCTVLLIGIGCYYIWGDDDYFWIARIVMLTIPALTVVWLVLHIVGYRFRKYAFRTKDIVYQSGWLWRTLTIVPFHRIQHCAVKQSPIQKQLGVATLDIYTAGGVTSDLNIGGLKEDVAHRIRDFILTKTQADEEE